MTSDTRQKGEQAAKDVGETLSTEAQKLKDTATKEAQTLAGEARDIGHDHADQQFKRGKEVVEGQVDTFQHAIGDAADRLDEEGHPLASYAKELSSQLERLSSKIESSTMDDVARDGRRLAKDNPGLFMLGAVAVGFAASRFLKASDRADRDYASDELADRVSNDRSGGGYGYGRGRSGYAGGAGGPGRGYPTSGYADRNGDHEAYRSPVAERDHERAGTPTPVPVPRDSMAGGGTVPPSSGGMAGSTQAATNLPSNDLDAGKDGNATDKHKTNPEGAN